MISSTTCFHFNFSRKTHRTLFVMASKTVTLTVDELESRIALATMYEVRILKRFVDKSIYNLLYNMVKYSVNVKENKYKQDLFNIFKKI